MYKYIFSLGALILSCSVSAQSNHIFSGGFESNAQYYISDKQLNVTQPDNPIRSNNYLLLNYQYKGFTAGLQAEGYESEALLNFNPKFNQTNVATYFLQFKNKFIDVTAGYFYEQFGSGLLYRSWEDRALGINNSLMGGRVIARPIESVVIKSIYGRQRTGFELSEGVVFGGDVEWSLDSLLKLSESTLSIGATYIGRDEATGFENPNFARVTNGFGARTTFSSGKMYGGLEYNYKSKDGVVEASGQVQNTFVKPGSALLLNMGYASKGFGIDGTFRRLENFSFFSERAAKGNVFNDRILNFIPSLTKQHHFNLANIYVYQSQPNVILGDQTLVKAGEIGGQIDLFYEFPKGSAVGGKYGTKVALNMSNWHALSGDFFILPPKDFETDFLGFGNKYFSDYNIEISKKFNNKFQGIFGYINQYYNKKLVEETEGLVRTNIVAAEGTYRFNTKQSTRFLLEHMWADSDRKNWASFTAEYNVNQKLSFYVMDLYNYGNDDEALRKHYYNFGTAYRKNSTRIAFSYGRQRGGLVCVGGVCRFVPESTGFSLSLNTAF